MLGFSKVFKLLYNYSKKHLDRTILLTLFGFLSAAIFFNYRFNFERDILGSYQGEVGYFWLKVIYYVVPYLVGCLAIGYQSKNFHFFRKAGFWFVLLVFCASLSFDSVFQWHGLVDAGQQTSYFFQMILSKANRSFFYLFPLVLYFVVLKRCSGSFFGLQKSQFDYKPYLLMMLIMVPLLVWASFNDSFLNAYPSYHPESAEAYWGVPIFATFIPYEIMYALTFLALEVLFRGFIIFEMEQYLGDKVVIPMVVVYCTLHFGKPLMECISSIFGGFILGVMALRTRSVYGGVWVHIFIAVGMDVLALMQKFFFLK